MKKFTLFCSLSMVFACGGDDDSGATSAPTTMGMDTDASTGSTGDAPTTNTPTTNDSDPTTGPTTGDPDTGETEDPDDDTGEETADTEEDTDEPGEAISFAEEVWPILDNCSCHKNPGHPSGLQMPDANAAHANLVGVMSSQNNQLARVEPGSPADSYLYQKLTDTHGNQFDQMPPSGPLPDADIDLIALWIEDGAEP